MHEIDLVPDPATGATDATRGINHLVLPAGARPFDLTTDRAGRRLYVSDKNRPTVYVIDIDPFSAKYNQLIQTLNFPATIKDVPGFGRIGLRGLAVSSDGKWLHVTAPVKDLFLQQVGQTGAVLAVPLTDKEGKALPLLTFDPNADGAVTLVGPGPFEITATDDPNVMLVTDRVADAQGVSALRREENGDVVVTSVNLANYGMIPRLVEGRGTQVHGVSNAQGVQYIRANAFKDRIGEHPAYAVITGFRSFTPDDPKHDPNIGPFFAYNAYLSETITLPANLKDERRGQDQ